ncbi:MAG: nucleoside-triphosphatase [Candidatus Korarchaeota archaeon]|nr:nucleoside-triphosphatase [Candidatus Korarchaeota archaeon]
MARIRGLVITGRPGSGKTTLFNSLIGEARRRGLRIAGFSCPEERVAGRRVGFRIRDLASGREAWLARTQGCVEGPRIGRYHVCVEEALDLGLQALSRAGDADILGIDELGPMELGIPRLREAIIGALSGAERFIVVAHARLRDQGVLAVIRGAGVEWVAVDPRGRASAWRRAHGLLDEMIAP